MRCLYCGKELALLKRLRGGGEFCSEAHKQRYQEEYDKIALSRLLQAQKRVQNANAEPAQPPAAPPIPAAVEEPPAKQPEPEIGQLVATQIEAPIQIEAPTEIEAPMETVGFLVQKPGAAELPEDEPYLESWVEATQPPAVPQWAFERESTSLSTAGLVALKPLAKSSGAELDVPPANLITKGLPPGDQRPSVPPGLSITIPLSHPLPVGRSSTVEVPPRGLKVAASGIRAVDFHIEVEFGRSALWSHVPAAVEFPAEDSGRIAQASSNTRPVFDPSPVQPSWEPRAAVTNLEYVEEPVHKVPANGVPANREPANEERATPHATLEALSRMHQVMQLEPAAPTSPSEPAAVVITHPPLPATTQETSATQEPAPRGATDLLDIPIKIITPSKRVARAVNALSLIEPALVPRLKALPLRPKVAPAPLNSVPEAKAVQLGASAALAKPKAQSSVPTKAKLASKPEQPASKPKIEGAQATPVSKAAPLSKAVPVSKAAQPAKSSEQTQQPGKAAEATSIKPVALSQAANPLEAAKGPASTKSGQREQPVAAEPGARLGAAEFVKKSEPTRPAASDEGLPSFGSIGRPATLWGSLKVKLGIAILLVAGCCTAYFGWGGKSQKTTVPGTTASADGAGPSIILGEGGWVVGWGGDSADARSGREITIYRPSLKLSNYRVEFQGDIETNSMGWVFRASDPDNYYAMKLTTVSTGVSPKVALFKYIVVKGRQTQVGRVPIDIDVRNDTVFKVRVDVRGPKFSTYVQGQPVDVWTDDQLKAGGVGFLNERGERGRIKSVSIRYLTGDDK